MDFSFSLALGGAWRRMGDLLFRPFNLGLWFVLGFTAWLADFFGDHYGGGLRYLLDAEDGSSWRDWTGDASRTAQEVTAQAGLLALVLLLIVVGLLVGLVLLWVGSRGQFVFLDNLVHRRAEVSRPWRAFAAEGDRLFLWQLVYMVVVLVVVGVLALVAVATGGGLLALDQDGGALVFFVLAGIGVFVLAALLVFVEFFLLHAVVPIMWKHRCGVGEAWRRFFAVFGERPWPLLGLGLLQLVVGLAGAAVVMAAGLATCCVGLLVVAIPYLGTVVTLPLPVFQRYLDLEVLARLSPDWDLLELRAAASGDVEGDGAVVRPEDVGPDAGGGEPRDEGV